MEFFTKSRIVRLRSHLNKYLVAADDQTTTWQSLKGGATRKSRWTVELVDGNPRAIRLKSCYNRYLAASDEPSLLTGGKILQTRTKDCRIDWQPIRDGFQVKLRAYGGTYLRANGGTPPWRNTVTHEMPRAPTRDWIVWDVEAVEVADFGQAVISSFSSVSSEICRLGIGFRFGFGSAVSLRSGFSGLDPFSPRLSMIKSPLISIPRITISMDLFEKAKVVRLKSAHGKYLTAGNDEVSVTQCQNRLSGEVKWAVEFIDKAVRLKSCYGKYLTAAKLPFLLGVTGRKVLQTLPERLNSSVEWEPFCENGAVKLKARNGKFLRANSGLPQWRYSVTHDSALKDWVLWEVHVVEFMVEEEPPPAVAVEAEEVLASESRHNVSGGYKSPEAVEAEEVLASESRHNVSGGYKSPEAVEAEEVLASESRHNVSGGYKSPEAASLSRQESNSSVISLPPKGSDGRLIYFRIADENGKINEDFKELCITFKGNDVNELTWRLEEELGVDGLTVCARSPLNGKLCPLRLQLPPNNATMHVVVVPPSSEGDLTYS